MLYTGRVGADVTTEEAYEHARRVGIYMLASMKEALGELDRVESIVSLLGVVNAVADFKDHTLVVNGCTDLLVEVFGPERGRHGRLCMGAASMPHQLTVEIDCIALIRD